jgi:hypothetical protein
VSKSEEKSGLGLIAILIVVFGFLALIGSSKTDVPIDTTSETYRQGVQDEMIRNGSNPDDAEEFTRVLTNMEKEWRQTGKVNP